MMRTTIAWYSKYGYPSIFFPILGKPTNPQDFRSNYKR